MKLSELAEQLQIVQDRFGDVDLYFSDSEHLTAADGIAVMRDEDESIFLVITTSPILDALEELESK